MIEFSGILSKDCEKYLINRAKKLSFIGLCFACIILLIPLIILTFKNRLYLIAVISLIILPFISFFNFSHNTLDLILPNVIGIKNNLIYAKGKKFEYVRPISSVKKVIDFGGWYHIFFNYIDRCENFVCEKKLLKVGTIEDFENVFKEKIVRK